jgi:hypothetical protein
MLSCSSRSPGGADLLFADGPLRGIGSAIIRNAEVSRQVVYRKRKAKEVLNNGIRNGWFQPTVLLRSSPRALI